MQDLPIVRHVGDYAPVPYAAEVAGIHENTLQRAIARGDVHAVRLDGRTVLVSLASARAYTPQRKRQTRARREASDVGGTRTRQGEADTQPV